MVKRTGSVRKAFYNGATPLSSGIGFLLLALVTVTIGAVNSFPFEPSLSLIQRLATGIATAIFFIGLTLLLLGKTFTRRIAGMQAMAIGSGLVLLFLRPDPIAWIVVFTGWGVCVGITLWGRLLFRVWPKTEAGVGGKAPDQ